MLVFLTEVYFSLKLSVVGKQQCRRPTLATEIKPVPLSCCSSNDGRTHRGVRGLCAHFKVLIPVPEKFQVITVENRNSLRRSASLFQPLSNLTSICRVLPCAVGVCGAELTRVCQFCYLWWQKRTCLCSRPCSFKKEPLFLLSISHRCMWCPTPQRQQLTFFGARGYHKLITPTAVACIDVHCWGKGHGDVSETSNQKEWCVTR